MKLSKLFIIISILLVVTLCFCACKKDNGGEGGTSDPVVEDIQVPTGLKVSDLGLVTFTRVYGVTGYELDINGEIVSLKFASYDLAEFTNKPADGKFVIKVRTVTADGRSDWSSSIEFTLSGGTLLHPVIIGIDDGLVTWYEESNASSAVVVLNGGEEIDIGNVTEYDIKDEITSGEVTFSIYFKGDGVYYTDSATTTLIYNFSDNGIQLPKPQNVKMEGQTLTFDTVIGADVYYLKDYNNTVISTNVNSIDLSAGYLTAYVSAGNTSGAYAASKEAEVTYFAPDGGTAENPYIINTAEEFRFIEYYEGMGVSAYYKLGADLDFNEIEDVSDIANNCYKLGVFSGHLDGDGYALNGLIKGFNDGYTALFNFIEKGASIENLVINNAYIHTWTVKTADGVLHEKGGEAAILCYTNRGTISNVIVNDSSVLAEKDGAAGLVGINYGTIKNCQINGTTVKGVNETGGIAIYNESIITECVVDSTVSGKKITGGIVARNAGIISKCDNVGTVEGSLTTGGIVGYNYNVKFDNKDQYSTKVQYCSNLGTVSGLYYVGGIVGQNGSNGVAELGYVSRADAEISSCYNAGTVKGVTVLGGIVGINYSETVSDCFNVGTVARDTEVSKNYLRIVVDSTNCNWIGNDNASFNIYYWQGTANKWPGDQMMVASVGGRTYYYIDLDVDEFENIIFTRATNVVHNKTPDLKVSKGNYMYVLPTDWENTVGEWKKVDSGLNNLPAVIGSIAGYSNTVSYCIAVGNQEVSNANGDMLANNQVSVSKIDAANANSQSVINSLNDHASEACWTAGTLHVQFNWQ